MSVSRCSSSTRIVSAYVRHPSYAGVTDSEQKALKDRGIDQMLEDARADNKENDVEYLRPKGR
jgi:hypothetical protein